MSTSEDLCQLCQEVKFKYTCPRCNILYCSVLCYKSPQHLKCSEEFYKNCIQEELTTAQPNSSEDVRKIYEILKRIRETDAGIPPDNFEDGLDESLDSDDEPNAQDVNDDGEEDEEEDDLASRMQGIDINDADEVWQRLSEAERQEFKQMVEGGEIMKLLPDYKPWWCKRQNSKIVDLSIQEIADANIPQLSPNIAKFSDICKKTPSPCLHYNLWNIMAAYACTARFFGGEHLTNPWEAALHLINLSSSLKYNTNFEDTEDAIVSVEMEALTTAGGAASTSVAVESREQLQQDARQLMSSLQYKLAALSNILELLQLAKQWTKRAKKEDAEFQKLFAMCSGNVELNRNKLQQLVKKIEFFLAYVKRNEEES